MLHVTTRQIHNKAQSRIIIKRRMRIYMRISHKACRMKTSIVVCTLTVHPIFIKEGKKIIRALLIPQRFCKSGAAKNFISQLYNDFNKAHNEKQKKGKNDTKLW